MTSISIRFPFRRTENGGVFDVNETTDKAIRSNLISLLTTKRGHRVMQSNLFSPLFDFLMEQWDEISEDELREQLLGKISEYLGGLIEVNKINLELQDDDKTLFVEIVYSILQLGGVLDGVELFIALDSID